jgi:hypothetical protein
VTVQHFGLVLVLRRSRPVRVQHQGPAPAVNRHLMVEAAQQHAVFEAGGAAVGLVLDVVDLAGGGGLVAAAGPAAVPVAQDDGVPDPGRDRGAVPDVQRQARPAQPRPELPPPQERGQPARPRQQVHGLAQNYLFSLLRSLPHNTLASVTAELALPIGYCSASLRDGIEARSFIFPESLKNR